MRRMFRRASGGYNRDMALWMHRALGVFGIAVVIATAVTVPAHAGPLHRCQAPSNFGNVVDTVRARNTSCAEARRVIRNARLITQSLSVSRGKAGSYRCSARLRGEGASMRCRGPGGNRVSYNIGS